MKRIISTRKVNADLKALHTDPVLARVFAARGVKDATELDYRLQQLAKPTGLLGINKAVHLIAESLQKAQKITLIGDYDADGATSVALAVTALRAMGCQHVDYLVPNRFEDGYGLSPPLAQRAKQRGSDLLITVDNGIASHTGVSTAVELGMRVIVTDHHLAPDTLPAADAIVNPNQPGDKFPSKNLAGVGVIFYVMAALRSHLRTVGWFDRHKLPVPTPAEWLDLVALGTVADVVKLDANNRILVEQGLRRMRAGRCRPGIAALVAVAGRALERLTPSDLGFAIGPRLNAAGRLEDMQVGIACLLSTDPSQATTLAQQLDQLNLARREIEADMQQQAIDFVEALPSHTLSEAQLAICLFDPDWHQGVIGLVASRIKERYHRPTIAFATGEDGSLRGSARSIPGVHIRDVLADVDATHPGLLDKFGGHAMAAGMSLEAAHLPAFEHALQAALAQRVDPAMLTQTLETDGVLDVSQLTLGQAQTLRFAGPWGQGFPEPLFQGKFRLAAQRVVGEKHLKLELHSLDSHSTVDAIAFNQAALEGCKLVNICYRLDVNHWRGQDNLQLVIEHVEPAVDSPR